MNTRRVRRALAKLFEGHIKDVVSRAWQKTRAAWQAWQERDLAGDDIVRRILRHGGQGSSGSQGHRHRRRSRSIRRDGQKVVLAIRNMARARPPGWLV